MKSMILFDKKSNNIKNLLKGNNKNTGLINLRKKDIKDTGNSKDSVTQEKKPRIGRRILRGAAATVVGISVAIAGLFSSPEDMLSQQAINQLDPDYAVEIVIDDEDTSKEDEKKKTQAGPQNKSLFARMAEGLRRLVLKLPVAVRAIVCVPLWGIGYVIIHLVSLIYTAAVSPVLRHILNWVVIAAVLLGVFTLTIKTVFPDMPIKKILNKKNIFIVLAGALILKVIDIVLPLFWGGYSNLRNAVMLISGLVIISLIIIIVIRHKRKKALRQGLI